VWLYFRFTLSFRDVEEMLAQRGVEASYEAIRAKTRATLTPSPGLSCALIQPIKIEIRGVAFRVQA
jgi:hypothetical protein